MLMFRDLLIEISLQAVDTFTFNTVAIYGIYFPHFFREVVDAEPQREHHPGGGDGVAGPPAARANHHGGHRPRRAQKGACFPHCFQTE